MSETTKLRRCPDPSDPGMFIVRKHKGGALRLVEVKRTREGLLVVHNFGWAGEKPISEFDTESKWWGPLIMMR